jgi:glutathione S-transferase
MTIKVHHLNNSKSQRILWALEELGLDYEIVFYKRQPSFAAPDDIKNIHPLGKAPVVEIDDFVMAESGAVVQYLIERYGEGKFMPDRSSSSYAKYIELMHYPEGSLSPPLLDQLFIRMLPVEDETFKGFTQQRVMNHLSYVDGLLEGQDYLIDNEFSGADLQLTFNLQGANAGGGLRHYKNLEAFVQRMEARQAYQRSIDKGGEFSLGFKK